MSKEIIKLDNIDVIFKQKDKQINAVKDVTLHVSQGDIYGVVGYSGAGKSTLVRVINLLQLPTSGRVEIGGDVLYQKNQQEEKIIDSKKLREKRRKIGMIFQHFNLLNEQTIIQNVAFALKHSGLNEKDILAKAKELLKLVGLDGRENSYPVQLSGGQQQRVAIARALANDPEILISDEATSALDPKNTVQILDLLKDLNSRLGLTIVLITHEMDAVKRIANKVAVMDDGQIVERGDLLQIFTNAKEKITREFIGGSAKAIATLQDYHLAKLQQDEQIFQLTYRDKNVSEPILIKLYKDFDVEANIIYSNIEVLRGTPVGTLFVIIKGSQADQQRALEYLQSQNIIITQISEQTLVEGGNVK